MFLERESHKPKNKGELELCNEILQCQSIKPKCKIIHNRDKNAVQNMLNIVKNIFLTGKRPDLFCRFLRIHTWLTPSYTKFLHFYIFFCHFKCVKRTLFINYYFTCSIIFNQFI